MQKWGHVTDTRQTALDNYVVHERMMYEIDSKYGPNHKRGKRTTAVRGKLWRSWEYNLNHILNLK